MKTLAKMLAFALLLILAFGIKGAKAHDKYTKVVKEEYPITPDGQLIISNKFGKVHCNNWDKNAVSFEITVTVEASDDKVASTALDRIDFVFNSYPSQIEAKTRFKEGAGQGNTNIKVDYIVNMPASINLDITNKFGDIYINETTGKSKINLGYGNLEANKLGNSDNLLDINFGKANVKWMKGAVTMLKYSNMELEYTGNIRLDSKYSNLDADKIISMNASFEGGKLKVRNSTAIEITSKFADLEIERIDRSLTLDIQYGNCRVSEMPAEFTNIRLNNKFGNVSVHISENAVYQLDSELSFCDLDYPSEHAKLSYRSVSPLEKIYRGIVGEGTDTPAAKVFIRAEYGSVSLK